MDAPKKSPDRHGQRILWTAIVALLLTAIAIAVLGANAGTAAAAAVPGATQPGWTARLKANVKASFTDGKSELQRALEAKKDAKSFRMTTTLRLHPGRPLETMVEVSCPDRERFTTTIGASEYQAVRIADKAYVQQEDKSWKVQDTAATGWSPCGENPGEPAPWAVMNEGRDPVTVLARMGANTEITRGAFIGTPAGNCQQWVVNFKLPENSGGARGHGGGGIRYTLCINPDTHLPLSVAMGSGGIVTTYSDWNTPVQIDLPNIPEGKLAQMKTPEVNARNPHALSNPHGFNPPQKAPQGKAPEVNTPWMHTH